MSQFEKALSYDDISIVPRVISEQEHRNGDTSIKCFGIKLDVPIIASPMPDVCNGKMAQKLAELNCMGIIHRFQKINDQMHEYTMSKVACFGHGKLVACAIGVTDDYQERFKVLYATGCRIFCLDVANGANKLVEKAVKWIRATSINHTDRIYLIAGNVATKEGYKFLADLGVDAVRVGIAGGCFTPNMEVITDKGKKKISDVIEYEDYVLSHDGTYNLVSNKFEFERNEEIAIINGIKCTLNHEFFVIKKEDENIVNDENYMKYGKWITAEEILKNPALYLFIDIAGGSNHERKENMQEMQKIDVV